MKPIKTLAKNQLSIETDGKIIFQSYDTIVCIIENDVIKITENQPQSKTTAKFVEQCITIALKKKGLNSRYLQESRPIVKKTQELLTYLLIDLEYSIEQCKEVIKNRIEKNTLTV
jgi:hypothetical protein